MAGRMDSLPHPSLIVAVLFGNLEILFGCQFCRIQHKVNIFACFDANPA
jgi:hypothetical protein